MGDITSREKAVYWILIVLIVVGGGAGLAYYFTSAKQSATSLADLAAPKYAEQSLGDIVAPGPSDGGGDSIDSPSPTPTPTPTPTPQPSAPTTPVDESPTFPSGGVDTPIFQATPTTSTTTTSGTTSTTSSTSTSSQLAGGGTTQSSASLASGSVLPDEPPTTGVGALALAGAASLGVSGLAGSLALRRPRKKKR